MADDYFVPNCTECGSRDVAEEIWGDPDLGILQPLEEKGYKFDFKGCVIGIESIEPIDDDGLDDDEDNDCRNFRCITCSNEYSWRDWRRVVKLKKEKGL